MASMKVRATMVGLYDNKLREVGEEFEITDGQVYDQETKAFKVVPVAKVYSKRWMEKVDEEVAASSKGKK